MKVLNPMSWGAALGAGLLATVTLLPQARGELVYEGAAATPSGAQAPTAVQSAQIDDRSTMRQALGASEKVQVTLQTQQQPAPTDVTPAAGQPTVAETENMSKAELMRRERQREELKNEDILQERLEELRLRDERRRTQDLLSAGATATAGTPAAATAPVGAAAAPAGVVTSEVVVAPVTDRPVAKPSLAPAMAAPVNPAATDTVMASQAQANVSMAPGPEGVADRDERTMFSVSPHAGLSNMIGDATYFQVTPHFGGGLAASVGTGDYISFAVGYTFNQYGISMASSNPWAIQQQAQAAFTGQSMQTLNMNQNVFDAGIKVHFLGPDSRIRPFVGGGGSYAMSYINFNGSILSQMNAYYHTNMSPDYQVNNFLGYLSAGSDFRVTKNISVGAEFRYYAVLTDSENGTFSNYYPMFAYGGYGYPYGYSGVNALNADPQVAGGSIARNNFYSIMGNVTFHF